jgi:hypothetical protein
VATWDKSELSTGALKFLGVAAAGQSISAEDDADVQKAIDSIYAQVRTFGIAPFPLSAIPEWAQWPLMKWVAVEVGPLFGKLLPFDIRHDAEKQLRAQMQGDRPPIPAKAKYY